MSQARFLTVGEVVLIHGDQIVRYSGSAGLRDIGLLESAVAQPAATFGGRQLHTSLIEMASAYAFHVCRDHPFVDGNQRAVLASALVFLELNGVTIEDLQGLLYRLMIDVASGKSGKSEIAEVLRRLTD